MRATHSNIDSYSQATFRTHFRVDHPIRMGEFRFPDQWSVFIAARFPTRT
jgi:hypothetical protein